MQQEIKPFKIKDVTLEQRKAILDVVTSNTQYRLELTSYPKVMYFWKENNLSWSDYIETFEKSTLPEITYQQFYDMYIERYFRLITQRGWPFPFFIKDKIYKGTLTYEQKGVDKELISTYVEAYPKDWEEVTYNEYIKQEEQFKKYILKQDNMKVEVSAELIKEAHKDSTPVWKNRWEKECPELFITYRTGQRFLGKNGEEFILALFGEGMCCFISLVDGNRFREPVKVKYPHRITKEEFESMGGYNFTLIK